MQEMSQKFPDMTKHLDSLADLCLHGGRSVSDRIEQIHLI